MCKCPTAVLRACGSGPAGIRVGGCHGGGAAAAVLLLVGVSALPRRLEREGHVTDGRTAAASTCVRDRLELRRRGHALLHPRLSFLLLAVWTLRSLELKAVMLVLVLALQPLQSARGA